MNISKPIIYTFILLIFSVFSCTTDKKEIITNPEDKSMDELIIDPNFDYNLSRSIDIHIVAINADNQRIPFLRINLYYPEAESIENLNPDNCSSYLIFSGATNSNGILDAQIYIPSYYEEVVISSNYIGFIDRNLVKIVNNKIDFELTNKAINTPTAKNGFKNVQDYLTLGTWNSLGVPDYLISPNDVINADILQTINNALPESQNINVLHPEYLNESNAFNVSLVQPANVWVTFVHEGAGFKSALGFYTYQNGNAPSNASQITNKTLIFPNCSYTNSGGGLAAGNKVHIGTFAAGTVIEWFLVSNGWDANTSTVGNGMYTHYSQKAFNVENDVNLKRHNISLWYPNDDLILLGFEDKRRDLACDHDFNDVMFYVTVDPITALDPNDYPQAEPVPDCDNDGVTDALDDYPCDASKAFNNIYEGSLAFEDNWPSKGDYDFNDIVVDYHINEITNSANSVVEIQSEYTLKAMGASYHNGFGVEFNTSYNNVTSVTGGELVTGLISLNPNGTEAGQTNAVAIVFDDGFSVLPHPGGGIGVNTTLGATYVQPTTISQTIVFTTPVSVATLGQPPFNPFIISNSDRGKEIHLPNYAPTDLINESYFGQNSDTSDPLINRYFKTSNNLPWAICIPATFNYPIEKVEVVDAYLHFADWAESAGTLFSDWYTDDNPDFINPANIYTHP